MQNGHEKERATKLKEKNENINNKKREIEKKEQKAERFWRRWNSFDLKFVDELSYKLSLFEGNKIICGFA